MEDDNYDLWPRSLIGQACVKHQGVPTAATYHREQQGQHYRDRASILKKNSKQTVGRSMNDNVSP